MTLESTIGIPPLVVLTGISFDSGKEEGTGVALGIGEEVGVAEALGVGEPNILDMKLVVDLKAIKPMMPTANMVRSPVMNDFISYIIYQPVK